MFRHLLRRASENESRDVLLACLLSFTKRGQEEISLPEILDGVFHLKQALRLGYEFSRDLLYSSRLFEDIAQLEEHGYVRRHVYTHDAFLPKSYVTLTMLGRGHAEMVTQHLTEPTLEAISKAVQVSIGDHKEYWRLYSRV